MFGLMSAKVLLDQTFPSEAAAQRWGEWNARGRGTYKVVPIDAQGRAVLPPTAPREGGCCCVWHADRGDRRWGCPQHGSVEIF